MKKKAYEKPSMKVIKIQHQGIICTSGGQVQSLRGGYFDYGGSDEDYDGGAR